ncbi:acetyl-CoA carboxylase biotin carboxyl carrier protein subunit [Halanaerobiaceae bacterium Z-7014]|uniref:Acetyl-CoA carboxylase biotin carboxyl carrier protein subunit n=1 Tax=Halonatronomonas betaini TaxID=2778430 RepID=A0A931AWR5_9FIRM|nr:biotin/lipoyl-containing protein [Halonatronomonas betaini]MBF8438129.1 acetyl-CoA carboxylase biotin carboxyl carrier protein subunit [Halonatronomonas betaini]
MSKKFKITVEGKTYEVEVEELGATSSSNPSPAQPAQKSERVQAPASKKSAAGAKKQQPAATGGGVVEAPMTGKIIDVKVSKGEEVSQGDLIVVLEAMKMENEIYAPAAGEVTEIMVAAEDSVDSGDPLLKIE